MLLNKQMGQSRSRSPHRRRSLSRSPRREKDRDRRRSRSRSRSPRDRDKSQDRDREGRDKRHRSRSDSPDRDRDRRDSRSRRNRDSSREEKKKADNCSSKAGTSFEFTEGDREGKSEEEIAMMKMFGFCGFNLMSSSTYHTASSEFSLAKSFVSFPSPANVLLNELKTMSGDGGPPPPRKLPRVTPPHSPPLSSSSEDAELIHTSIQNIVTTFGPLSTSFDDLVQSLDCFRSDVSILQDVVETLVTFSSSAESFKRVTEIKKPTSDMNPLNMFKRFFNPNHRTEINAKLETERWLIKSFDRFINLLMDVPLPSIRQLVHQLKFVFDQINAACKSKHSRYKRVLPYAQHLYQISYTLARQVGTMLVGVKNNCKVLVDWKISVWNNDALKMDKAYEQVFKCLNSNTVIFTRTAQNDAADFGVKVDTLHDHIRDVYLNVSRYAIDESISEADLSDDPDVFFGFRGLKLEQLERPKDEIFNP